MYRAAMFSKSNDLIRSNCLAKTIKRPKSFYQALAFLALSLLSSINSAAQSGDNSCWHNYAVNIKTHTIFNFNGSTPTRHSLQGFLATRPLTQKLNNPRASVWAMQLHEVKQKGNGSSLPAEAFLETPFAFEILDNGLIGEFYFPTNMSDEEKDRLKGLAFYFQAQHKTFSKKSRLKERDTLGLFEADYKYDKNEITKTKTAYRLDHDKASLIQSIQIQLSENLFVKNDCLFSDISGKEQIELSNNDRSYHMEVKQDYSLKLTPKKLSPLLWSLPESLTDWKLLSSTQTKQLTKEELAALRTQFLTELQSINLLDYRPGDLAKWLTQFDLVISSIESYFKGETIDDAVQMRIFAALGLVDSPNSNRLLISLANDLGLDETNRFRALRALTSGTKALTPEHRDQLTELLSIGDEFGSPSLQSAAVMAVGAVVSRRESNEYSDALITNLSDHLSPNIPEDRQAALIASLGNTMNPEVITKVETYAQADSQRVRSNVATSLGQIGGERAKSLLRNMLHTESEERPQQAVLNALSNFQLDAQDIQKAAEIGLESSSERTRKQAIVLLGNQSQSSAQAAQHLKKIMSQETSRKNFGLAAKNLVRLKKQSKDSQIKRDAE